MVSVTDRARGRWYEAAGVVGKGVDGVLEILPEVRAWVAAQRKDRNLGPVAEDLEEQLASLTARLGPLLD